MTSTRVPVTLRLNPANPGEFFACCGLLDLADRLWGGAEGWFAEDTAFCMSPTSATVDSPRSVLEAIAESSVASSMKAAQLERREELSKMPAKVRAGTPELEDEKKELDAQYREAPVVLGSPFDLIIDWFLDGRAGGKDFKTWAGQQSVIDIATGMKAAIDPSACESGQWFSQTSLGDSVPFNFDSDLGGAGSDRDVGFAFDPLKSTGLVVRTRPLVEFAAFIGLQRFRPRRIGSENCYEFYTWREPLMPELASTIACGAVDCLRSNRYTFRLLYRTKYLKSFLPATTGLR